MTARAPLPQLPPHSIEAEQSLLGGLMLDNTAWNRIAGLVADADFYRDDHRRIFRHTCALIDAGRPADVVTVFESLERSGEAEQAGGLAYLGEIANNTPSAANIHCYAEIVRGRAAGREVQAVADRLIAEAARDPSGAAAAAAAALSEIAARGRTEAIQEPLTLGAAAARTWPAPEYVIEPLQAGDVAIISGADGIGKSWVALAMAATVAYGQRIGGIFPAPARAGRVLYLAGEDRTADHGRRLACLAGHMGSEHGIRVSADHEMLTLHPLEGRRMPLFEKRQDRYVPTAYATRFSAMIRGYRLVMMDPLRMFHDLEENDGVGMDKLVRWMVRVAMENGQAIVVIHHVSQSAMLDSREDHHAGRGATDFPAGCRGGWTLRGMTPSEAKTAGISEDDRRDWRCLINGKANHGREAGRVWLQRRAGGLLVRSHHTPGEFEDARGKKGRPRLNAVKTGARDDDF